MWGAVRAPSTFPTQDSVETIAKAGLDLHFERSQTYEVTMKPTRRQHIVSSRLLSNFTDDSEVLWVYTKDRHVRPSKPERECWERDFFEFELHGRKTNNRYENWLAQIEGEAWPILQLLIERRRLSDRQARSWAEFVASLFGRTRKVRAQISEAMVNRLRGQTDDPEFLRELQYWLLQRGELHYAEDLRKKVADFRTAREIIPS